jgi:putative phage-type endonuclease
MSNDIGLAIKHKKRILSKIRKSYMDTKSHNKDNLIDAILNDNDIKQLNIASDHVYTFLESYIYESTDMPHDAKYYINPDKKKRGKITIVKKLEEIIKTDTKLIVGEAKAETETESVSNVIDTLNEFVENPNKPLNQNNSYKSMYKEETYEIKKTNKKNSEEPSKKTEKIYMTELEELEALEKEFNDTITEINNNTYDKHKPVITGDAEMDALESEFCDMLNGGEEGDEGGGDGEGDGEDSIPNFPLENYPVIKRTDPKFGPYGTQWINDVQVDDIDDDKSTNRWKQVQHLMAIEYPEQRSAGWFKQRDGAITASDLGTALDQNHYEEQYKFIIKKVMGSTFKGNKNTYHGKKYEKIATMVYEYRMNVHTEEFGMVVHSTYSFLGASPDGIIGRYKQNEKNLTNLVGRMLEIKCPVSRQIKTEGEVKGNICPTEYWIQVQFQMECCNLDACDFWQCSIYEYKNKDEFLKDTDVNEPFRSKFNQLEKGCTIQLLPKEKRQESYDDYFNTIFEYSTHIYPPKVQMSPYECDKWIEEQLKLVETDKQYENVYVDKVLYWRINLPHCVTIERDKQWFKDNLPTMEKIWKYVEFFRLHKEDIMPVLLDYIDSLTIKRNKIIMSAIEMLYTCDPVKLQYVKDETAKNIKIQEEKALKYASSGGYIYFRD